MNIEKDLQDDGIVVTEMLDTELVLKITQNIAKKIVSTFPEFELSENDIFSKLFSLNMYRAKMPDGMAEASYCYKNSSIYFNSHIQNEDLEEFGIHECLHFLQEVKNHKGKIKKMGLSNYSRLNIVGNGLNEAAVQYISSKIIGIKPDYEKYYDINIFTPSPSYYPIECALLNELIYLVGEDILFKSTYFSTDDFKKAIIKATSSKVFYKIQDSFDKILNLEEKIVILNNKLNSDSSSKNISNQISSYREDIKATFIETQNLIIKEFFDSQFNKLTNLEELDNYRRKLCKFKKIIGTVDNYTFYDDYCLEKMNQLEHKTNILENGGTETAIDIKTSPILKIFNKLKKLISDLKSQKI